MGALDDALRRREHPAPVDPVWAEQRRVETERYAKEQAQTRALDETIDGLLRDFLVRTGGSGAAPHRLVSSGSQLKRVPVGLFKIRHEFKHEPWKKVHGAGWMLDFPTRSDTDEDKWGHKHTNTDGVFLTEQGDLYLAREVAGEEKPALTPVAPKGLKHGVSVSSWLRREFDLLFMDYSVDVPFVISNPHAYMAGTKHPLLPDQDGLLVSKLADSLARSMTK